MKATFEFNLPEDQDQYNMYRQAPNYYDALWDFDQELRRFDKSGINKSIPEIREIFHEIMLANNATLE